MERSPEQVLSDALDGLITRDSARLDYGVVIKPDGAIDTVATAAIRTSAGAVR